MRMSGWMQNGRRSVRWMLVGLTIGAGGFVGTAGTAAGAATDCDGTDFCPPTVNQRSITLIESKNAPGGALAGGDAFQPLSANQRSILLIESKNAPGGVLASGGAEEVAGVPAQRGQPR